MRGKLTLDFHALVKGSGINIQALFFFWPLTMGSVDEDMP